MEFNDALPTEKLDLILNYLVNSYKPPHKYSSEIKAHFKIEFTKEMYEILHKLERDGYILEQTPEPGVMGSSKYRSTFDGRLFIGYEKQRVLQDAELTKISRMETEDAIYRSKLFWATLIAGIAAVLLLLWQVWIWFYPIHANYPYWIWETIPKGKP